MMSMTSSFDTVMIHHFTKGIMKRLVAHRYVSDILSSLLIWAAVSLKADWCSEWFRISSESCHGGEGVLYPLSESLAILISPLE
jgi:hypothetical protein